MKTKALISDYMLGSRIKLLREKHELKQIELARLLGISSSSLSQYEAGYRTPNDALKIRIADIFGVSVDFLIGHMPIKIENTLIYAHLSKRTQDLISISEKLSEDEFDKVLEYAHLLSIKHELK